MLNRLRSSIKVVVVLTSLLLLVPAPALALNDNPQSPVELSAAKNSASDNLVGNTGGAYRFYSIRYQGGSAPVLVSLASSNYGSAGSQAFGFNLYGPSGLSFTGSTVQTSSNTSIAQYTLVNPAAMDVLIQVYNYTAGMPISYTLTVSGLSGGSTSGVVTQNNTTPDQAVSVPTINASLGGTIVGSGAGAFRYYTFNYPGGNSPVTITMNASPAYNGQGTAYGVNVYRANPATGATTLVATTSTVAQDANSMTLSATVSQRSAGTFQLQVFNYWAGTAVNYGITATGFATAASPASGNTDASHAIVLNSTHQGATETLTGNSGGAFDYFLVNYPGSQSQLYISVTYNSLAGIPANAVGFGIYNGSSLVATANPTDDGTGVMSANWGYQNQDAATFGIQVFNYAPGATVSYTIYQVGSQ